MKKYVIAYYPKPVPQAVVEANSADEAVEVLREHLGDLGKFSNYNYSKPTELGPRAKGRVVKF